MTIPTPPIGARVRHTSTYPDGTAVIVEGIVTDSYNGGAPPHVVIGRDRYLFLVDQPGFTVALEVLDVPGLPPEPPNGTVYSDGAAAWIRHDIDIESDGGQWWGTDTGQLHGYRTWQEVAPIVAQPGWRRHVPDPADTAPALPWDVEDKDEDSLEIVTSDLVGVAALVSVNSSSVYLAPAAAREAAGVLLRAAREFEERQR